MRSSQAVRHTPHSRTAKSAVGRIPLLMRLRNILFWDIPKYMFSKGREHLDIKTRKRWNTCDVFLAASRGEFTFHHGETLHHIGFHFHDHTLSRHCNWRNWYSFSVWLVKDLKLYFRDSTISQRSERRESWKCLWKTDIANLSEYFSVKEKFDGIGQVELKVSNIS